MFRYNTGTFAATLGFLHELVGKVPSDASFRYSLTFHSTDGVLVVFTISDKESRAYELWGVLDKVLDRKTKNREIYAQHELDASDGNEALYDLIQDLQNYNLDTISEILRGADVKGGDGHVLINTSDAEKLLNVINYLKQ